jgi:cholesterol oxidase
MSSTFDVVVIGSGFGGAVIACRLAEKGMSVLVLERGRRWEPASYPRKPQDAWIWDTDRPHIFNGWIDFRCYGRMAIVQGAGVGGGSLIYANVSVDARPELFDEGWPPEITYSELKPHYDRVGQMLGTQCIPENQVTERYRLMREGAERAGYADRFAPLPLAVTFDREWHYGLDDPFNERHAKTWTNPQGQEQGTCIHCGNCCIGCSVKAKNTLDLNYLPQAEQHGAEVRPLHLVKFIESEDGGYRVHFDHLENGRRSAGTASARRVVLAAGSLGSTELLFRCRDQYKSLPNVSPFLGRNWSSNADFLTPAFYKDRKISPTKGPTISCAIDFLDGSLDGAKFWIEDGGFPDVFESFLAKQLPRRIRNRKTRVLFGALGQLVRQRDPLSNMMPWFAQGIDAADGRLYLGRRWFAPWLRTLKLHWQIARSERVINAITSMHRELATVTGGAPRVPPLWTWFKTLVTPHPLGGCNMGISTETGVVDHRGEVFGYRGLYVADAAIIPRAIGRNPSKTIAALAERTADLMV